MPFIDAFPDIVQPTSTSDRLNLIFDIIPDNLLDNSKRLWEPRLKVNGTEVQIMGDATPSESESQVGWNLTVTLLKPADYVLFTDTASIDFGFGQKIDLAWDEATFVTIMAGAVVQGIKRTKVGPNNNPQDTASVTVVSSDLDKLAKTAERGLIIYDRDRTNISDADLKPIHDADGNSYTPEVIAVAGLKLSHLLAEVFITRCGFDWVRTDLPDDDYPILQYRVNIGQRFYDGVKGFLGMYSPAVTPLTDGDGDGIWITDTTIVQPAGFPAPLRIPVDRALSIDIGTERQRLDALILQYSSIENNYDFTTFLFDTPTNVINGGAIVIDTERITIEFRKITSPTTNVVVRSTLNIENTVKSALGVEIGESSETYEFDSKGRVTGQNKTTKALLPTGSTVYDTTAIQNVKAITENILYAPHPFKARADFVERRIYNETGLVFNVTDSVIATSNQPIKMDAVTAYRSSYVTTETTIEEVTASEEPMKYKEETAEPLRDGTVRVHNLEIDLLTGAVIRDDSQNRPGEVSVSGQGTGNDELLIYAEAGASRSVNRIETLSIQELPLKYGIPLGRRIIKQRQSDAGTVTIPVLGYDRRLRKGVPITPVDPRDGTDLGTFLIVGRSLTINKDGLVMNLTGRIMASTTQPPSEIERYSTVIDESASEIYAFPVYCLDGFNLSLDPSFVDNLTIEARHVEMPELPWTDLENAAVDLSAWDGTTENFEVRVTAGTVSAVTREAFGVVIGPA